MSFNHPHLTAKCLDSILDHFKETKVFLIHNGSDEKNINYLKDKYPLIQHIIISENKGFTGGANLGLKYVFQEFEWVYFYTNDVLTHAVPMQVPVEKGLFAPVIYRRKIEKIDSIGGVFYPWLKKIYHCKSIQEFNKKRIWGFSYIPGTAFLVHKNVFNEIGEFDETLHTYWEDVDYSVRINLKKLKLGVVQDWKLIHKVGKTCHKNKFYTSFLFQRNKNLISQRYRFKVPKIFGT